MVFWETTRACLLSCLHCRASAMTQPLPGELTNEEGKRVIDQVTSFGEPYPTLIFSGGDPLQRRDLFELADYAKAVGVNFALSPAVTDLLSHEALEEIKDAGTSSISISLDGRSGETHDVVRNKAGTFDRTIETIQAALGSGIKVQVNTAVMKRNLRELPEIFSLIRGLGVKTWELFFLIRVGRGSAVQDLTPQEYESVCRFLVDASRYGMVIRTVEAPFVRRVASQMAEHGEGADDSLYGGLAEKLHELEGWPTGPSTIRARGTLDGDGIVFVAYDGSIYPGGLTPFYLGDARKDSLAEVYRENPVLRKIRGREVGGYCGACRYKDICGGSRARAYAHYGDPLASDPACVYSLPPGKVTAGPATGQRTPGLGSSAPGW